MPAEQEDFQWSKGELVKMAPINDGEPCPHCKEKLPRFAVERTRDGGLSVSINCLILANDVKQEIDGIVRLLEMFIYGLGGKPKEQNRSHRRKKSNGTKG